MKQSANPRLVVIDGANAIYRAFFAIPNLRAPDGTPTGAAYGFVTMLIKVLREEKPTHLVIASDPPGGSFRREIFPEYKAGRDAQPEDLTLQFPIVAEFCEAFGVPMLEVPKFEADDVIATLVETAPEGAEVCIVSTDKDLMQLIRPGVEMLDSTKGRRIDSAAVEERFGVPPSQLLDVRALVGDPSDNIPGVKGIGEKGAAKLIKEFGDLDRLLEEADQVKGKRAREGLQAHADDARLSRKLSRLCGDIPLDKDWDALKVVAPDRDRLRGLYQKFGFTRLLDSLDAEMSAGSGAEKASAESLPPVTTEVVPIDVLRCDEALDALMDQLATAKYVAFYPVFDSRVGVFRRLVGLALASPDRTDSYLAMSGEGLFNRDGISLAALCAAIRKCFSSASRPDW
ncbi:MAG: 5'-3' exonuclease H3TH domain-containing protein, partial [Myxococcota bacterium]